MQTFRYTSGPWTIEAKLQEVGDGKRLAVITAFNEEDDASSETRHTVVFEHAPGCDEIEEAKDHIERALIRNH